MSAYSDRKEAGICVRCGIHPARRGVVHCVECSAGLSKAPGGSRHVSSPTKPVDGSHGSPRGDQKGWFRGRVTCTTCKRTVCHYDVDGKRVITDTDVIAILLDEKGTAILRARRLHSETCATYAAQLKRDELDKEKADYASKSQRNRTRGM